MRVVKKIIRFIMYGLAAWLIVKILKLLVLCLLVMLIPDLKMYFPWNERKAIQVAEDYYDQRYEKKIKYDDMTVFWLMDGIDETYYIVKFILKDEPECKFSIKVNYDLDTGEFRADRDGYLQGTMNGRMKKDIKEDIEHVYGKSYTVIIAFDSTKIKDEFMSLNDIKQATDCYITLYLEDHELTTNNKKEEAEKLFQFCQEVQNKGYIVKKVCYDGKKNGKSKLVSFSVSEISSIEDAKKIIDDALEGE